MRVFVLSAGRVGSTAFAKASGHLRDFTAGHETRSRVLTYDRTDYPDNHIEVDNRLAWFLGSLDQKYGNDAYYVKLIRNEDEIVNSYLKRWFLTVSIVRAFLVAVLMRDSYSKADRLNACKLYTRTVNDNIEHFLKDKKHVYSFNITQKEDDFKGFCDWLGVNCPQEAINEWKISHNPNRKFRFLNYFLKIPAYFYKRIRSILF